MNKKIILTGGGTAGHVIPNIAIIPKLREMGYDIVYIGSRTGIEKELIESQKIKYYGISTGKLRRYIDINNIKDPFRVIRGVFEASSIIKKEKPNIVFSKGGFVAIPVILGAFRNRVPIVSHESDITPGLANKIAMPFIKKICTTFPETERYIGSKKIELTGTPIRKELFLGSEIKGKEICKFNSNKPIIFVMGGSQGSVFINNLIRKNLDKLLDKFNIIHICGKNNLDNSLENKDGYIQNEYIGYELPHLLKISNLIISRAGSNSIYEILALKKPNILIPLSKRASRGDQILNARSFADRGFSEFIEEEDIKSFDDLGNLIDKVYSNREKYINNMNINSDNSIGNIINVIVKYSK
ncbi:undecaprenyldiphospho-muramoylpentapeptide beta-N-acetylglucosaminyltransferase [Candidatus Arthromitus sp. SFB-rat-Yit]|uniref:undecaprenyldiphospho-muramoylpentapeptide beta-N-acetylglucosaminyltransferase n=1 Tax=Candidatus Arthromitus sp. SFB-rat-Yit TaxID=1041504 RepID=UPI000227A4E3|nr:undecaprenyldiphospho-muramoylpentapeptide beta-N-acetylglucosaminyltransferase [Candidatus Arthromitus sp. SFB-rat-Yit]BAK80974.1 UDP-N-acetylglucosamine--N-acetylmuramyl-(pentapeptide) pyrophosphoryl-undecaprenol N-acetylglucosamine transferase [Candidatus Arthromitus sp. SFB-rat-Yit]